MIVIGVAFDTGLKELQRMSLDSGLVDHIPIVPRDDNLVEYNMSHMDMLASGSKDKNVLLKEGAQREDPSHILVALQGAYLALIFLQPKVYLCII